MGSIIYKRLDEKETCLSHLLILHNVAWVIWLFQCIGIQGHVDGNKEWLDKASGENTVTDIDNTSTKHDGSNWSNVSWVKKKLWSSNQGLEANSSLNKNLYHTGQNLGTGKGAFNPPCPLGRFCHSDVLEGGSCFWKRNKASPSSWQRRSALWVKRLLNMLKILLSCIINEKTGQGELLHHLLASVVSGWKYCGLQNKSFYSKGKVSEAQRR